MLILRYKESRQVPPIISVLQDPSLANDELIQVIAQQSVHAVNMPSIPEMAEVWVPMDSSLQLCLVGKQDVKSALDDAVKLINQQIEAFRSQM